jgi:hypothetical protein
MYSKDTNSTILLEGSNDHIGTHIEIFKAIPEVRIKNVNIKINSFYS